jgi:hypothetical protein
MLEKVAKSVIKREGDGAGRILNLSQRHNWNGYLRQPSHLRPEFTRRD